MPPPRGPGEAGILPPSHVGLQNKVFEAPEVVEGCVWESLIRVRILLTCGIEQTLEERHLGQSCWAVPSDSLTYRFGRAASLKE